MENIIKLKIFHLIKQINKKQKRISNSIYQQQSNIIASIPYIGEKYAERLLKSFKL